MKRKDVLRTRLRLHTALYGMKEAPVLTTPRPAPAQGTPKPALQVYHRGHTMKIFAFGLALAFAGGLALLLPLAAPALAFAATTPAGPLLVLLAILGQARNPTYEPAVLLVPMSDREYLASLLAQEVSHG